MIQYSWEIERKTCSKLTKNDLQQTSLEARLEAHNYPKDTEMIWNSPKNLFPKYSILQHFSFYL